MKSNVSLPATGNVASESQASTSSAIPYRTATSVPAGSVAWALGITMLVMIVLAGCATYARRRGWLPGIGIGARQVTASGIDIHASRRVSQATTVHLVKCGGAEYLLVETTRGTTVVVSPMHKSSEGPGEAA